MNDTSLFLTLSGEAAVLVSAYIISNPFAVPSRANERVFYCFSIAFSATAFLWVTSDALGLLAPNATSSWWFRVVIYRGWLVIGTAISSALLADSEQLCKSALYRREHRGSYLSHISLRR